MRVKKQAHVEVTCKSCNAVLEVERSDITPATSDMGRLTSLPSVTCPECGDRVSVWQAAAWGPSDRIVDLGRLQKELGT